MSKIGTFMADPAKLRALGLTLWVTMEPIPAAGVSAVAPKGRDALRRPGVQ
jgi:hypothetical protein